MSLQTKYMSLQDSADFRDGRRHGRRSRKVGGPEGPGLERGDCERSGVRMKGVARRGFFDLELVPNLFLS